MTYVLIGYMWLFFHRPFEIWAWLGDLRIERIYMISMFIVWLVFVQKHWIANRVNWGVGLMTLSIGMATLFGSHSSFESLEVVNWFKVLIFYIIVVSSVKTEEDLKLIIVSYVLITGLFELHSLYEYFCGRGVFRMGLWRMIGVGTSLSDPNSFAASLNYGISFLLPCLVLARMRWQRFGLYALFLLAIICIVLTGSRTGIAGLVFLFLIGSIFSNHRWKIIPVVAILLGLIWFILSDDLKFRYLTIIDSSFGPDNAQESADSRIHFLSIAFDIWKNNIFFGVGPGGFSVASGTEMQPHSLYAQLLSEVGLVGIGSFIVFIFCLLGNLLEARKSYQSLEGMDSKFLYAVVVAASLNMLQLMFLGLGGHNLFRFTWLWIAAFSVLALNLLLQKQLQSRI